MGIAALYQVFGDEENPCIRASARLKDMQNMMTGCDDYFVMHSWRKDQSTGDDHCIGVWEWGGKISVHFWGGSWANNWFKHFDFPMSHEIWIGLRPNNSAGSREYTSFTWWVYDKTTDEYTEETKDTPGTWISKSIDVALEMGLPKITNGLRKSMADLVVLDKNNNAVYLPNVFSFYQHAYPEGYNCHEEIYSDGGFKAECIQWKTHGVEPPDLVIDDIWVDNCYFYYRIKNIGGHAESTHTKLKINGVEKKQNTETSFIGHTSKVNMFLYEWTYSGGRDAIEVIADCNNEVTENKEGNNTLIKHFMCGDVDGNGEITLVDVQKVTNRKDDPLYPLDNEWAGDVTGSGEIGGVDVYHIYQHYLDPTYRLHCRCSEQCEGIDLTITAIYKYQGKVRFIVKNKGTISSPGVHPGFSFRIGMTWFPQGWWYIDPLLPGEEIGVTSPIDWPVSGTLISAWPDKHASYEDCNPMNNIMRVTA